MDSAEELLNSPLSNSYSGPQDIEAVRSRLPKNLRDYDIALGGCWIARKRAPNGYATNTTAGNAKHKASVYKLIYEIIVGPVPKGLELHHKCHNGAKGCVNPFHLEPCTHAENMERSHGIHQVHKRRTHCPQGHPYSPENTRVSRGRRYCITCAREHARKNREKYADKYRAEARERYRTDPRVKELQRARNRRARSPSLRYLLPLTPEDTRIGVWMKPFAVFKPNVNPAALESA